MEFKNIIKNVFVLLVLILLSLGLLFYINKLTKPLIDDNKDKAFRDQLSLIFDSFDSFNQKEIFDQNSNYLNTIYEIKKDNNIIGYALIQKAYGYQSEIILLVGFNLDKTIKEVRIIEQMETPGIGSKISNNEFLDKFNNTKKEDKVDTITGATVSSIAVINLVKKSFDELMIYYE
jgi:Na+-translocating ferredoxin:NAD+ oxidoreductase subunit G